MLLLLFQHFMLPGSLEVWMVMYQFMVAQFGIYVRHCQHCALGMSTYEGSEICGIKLPGTLLSQQLYIKPAGPNL